LSGDPVVAKLVESLARPGGNYTRMSMLSVDLAGKRVELLKELLPGLKRVAIISTIRPATKSMRQRDGLDGLPRKVEGRRHSAKAVQRFARAYVICTVQTPWEPSGAASSGNTPRSSPESFRS